ncbi:MAG: hypothetical protein QOJ96_855 [Alphaproteobacteria bacterium]|jgi:hypothetical protein|nr:hypothetical protein [Alphaproteobacteria bacterium]
MLGRWSEARRPRVRPHQPGTRDASGSRPGPLRGSAFNGWTGADEGRRKPPGSGGPNGRLRPRKHGPEVQSRRSGAPRGETHRSQGACRASQARFVWCAFSALRSPHVGEQGKRDRRARAAKNRARGALAFFPLLHGERKKQSGCLKLNQRISSPPAFADATARQQWPFVPAKAATAAGDSRKPAGRSAGWDLVFEAYFFPRQTGPP